MTKKQWFARLRFNSAQRSLGAKLRILLAGLMLLAVTGAIILYSIGTTITQNQLLRQQGDADMAIVMHALTNRIQTVNDAVQALSQDNRVAELVNIDNEADLQELNARAVTVRNRFEMDLIQIFDAHDQTRTNLLLSSLFRKTSLLSQISPNSTNIQVVDNNALILSRADLPYQSGAVIAGIDLESELERIVKQYRIESEIGLVIAGIHAYDEPTHISNSETFAFDAPAGRSEGLYVQQQQFTVGNRQITLKLERGTKEISLVTNSGLFTMLIGMGLMIVAVVLLSARIIDLVARPINTLAVAADAVARGDLSQEIDITLGATPLHVGVDDELGTLTMNFNHMVSELRGLYDNLESNVNKRTHALETTAEVARTMASSLDLDVIIRKGCLAIQRRLDIDDVRIYLLDANTTSKNVFGTDDTLTVMDLGRPLELKVNTLIGTAVQQHSACAVQDTHADHRYLPTTWRQYTRAVVAVPLMSGDDVIGVMELQSRKARYFDADTLRLLGTLSDQVSMGVINAQRYTAEQRRRRFTEVLELTGRVLTGNLDIEELPQRALSALRALVNFERGALWMHDADGLRVKAQYGYADERPMHRKQMTQESTLLQKIARDRRPLLLEDVTISTYADQPWLNDDRSWMGIPIITAKGECIGVIGLACTQTHAFSSDDAVWAQAFASQAGIALENANLYAKIAALHQVAPQMLSAEGIRA